MAIKKIVSLHRLYDLSTPEAVAVNDLLQYGQSIPLVKWSKMEAENNARSSRHPFHSIDKYSLIVPICKDTDEDRLNLISERLEKLHNQLINTIELPTFFERVKQLEVQTLEEDLRRDCWFLPLEIKRDFKKIGNFEGTSSLELLLYEIQERFKIPDYLLYYAVLYGRSGKIEELKALLKVQENEPNILMYFQCIPYTVIYPNRQKISKIQLFSTTENVDIQDSSPLLRAAQKYLRTWPPLKKKKVSHELGVALAKEYYKWEGRCDDPFERAFFSIYGTLDDLTEEEIDVRIQEEKKRFKRLPK